MTKKYINKNVFLCTIKNLNWKSLTKNLVTFKIWDGVEDQKFKYRASPKNLIFRESRKKLICWGELPKKGGLDSLQI